jgi:hypothetical protein
LWKGRTIRHYCLGPPDSEGRRTWIEA